MKEDVKKKEKKEKKTVEEKKEKKEKKPVEEKKNDKTNTVKKNQPSKVASVARGLGY